MADIKPDLNQQIKALGETVEPYKKEVEEAQKTLDLFNKQIPDIFTFDQNIGNVTTIPTRSEDPDSTPVYVRSIPYKGSQYLHVIADGYGAGFMGISKDETPVDPGHPKNQSQFQELYHFAVTFTPERDLQNIWIMDPKTGSKVVYPTTPDEQKEALNRSWEEKTTIKKTFADSGRPYPDAIKELSEKLMPLMDAISKNAPSLPRMSN